MATYNKSEIITLFENYRYRFLKDVSDVLVFEYASGMYSGIEIVPYAESVSKTVIEQLKGEFSRSGYATHVYDVCDIEQIEKDLFNGFFQTSLSNKKIKSKYKQYCKRVMLQYGKLPDDYEYIEVSYDKEIGFNEVKPEGSLVDSIYSLLQEKGAKLIIVEAPAGFGKTSTAYEVLSRYQDVERDVRPFMMELYKDRSASIFKYILLSNIDTDFDINIKSDIVIENIKKGRIPLLIDGFDELLSKDINGTVNSQVEFNEVESMLSTIAELLQGDAKILLTSRRTAIFSGEEFAEWYENLTDKGLNFDFVKYNLNTPSIRDWLDKDVISRYDQNLLKVLNNPVLLGFLKYCKADLDSTNANIVEKFFDLLLSREIERQDIPFTVEEQKIILRRLAMVLAGFNCSTDTRESIISSIYETSSKLISSKVTSSRDIDSLLNSLSNHALLNRKNDKVGFLNDFIYGIMLAESFLHYNIDDSFGIDFASSIQSVFLNKCADASVFLSPLIKHDVWSSMKKYADLNSIDETLCDWKLCGYTQRGVDGVSFDGELLSDVTFGEACARVSRCTFSNINFTRCTFDFNFLDNCIFVQCSFLDCIREGSNFNCYEYGCIDKDGILHLDEEEIVVPDVQSDDEIKKSILRKYFMVGSQRRRMKLISVIRKDYADNEKQFKRCISSLASDKLLIVNGDKSFITDEGVQWLQTIY